MAWVSSLKFGEEREVSRDRNGYICAIGSINSHDFHIIGDKLINPIVGVYVPIIRIPIKGWMTIPNTRSLDPGSYALGASILKI